MDVQIAYRTSARLTFACKTSLFKEKSGLRFVQLANLSPPVGKGLIKMESLVYI